MAGMKDAVGEWLIRLGIWLIEPGWIEWSELDGLRWAR